MIDEKDQNQDQDQGQNPNQPSTNPPAQPTARDMKSGGFMTVAPMDDWERELAETGKLNVKPAIDFSTSNGRELHGTELELNGVERSADGSETCKDILSRSLGGKPWDPGMILVFANQERGKGPGKIHSVRYPTEWDIVIEQILKACPDFDGNVSNFIRHAIAHAMLHFGFLGYAKTGAVENRIRIQQAKIRLEQNEAYLNEADELLELCRSKGDQLGFDSAAESILNGAEEIDEPWKGRVIEMVDRWKRRSGW